MSGRGLFLVFEGVEGAGKTTHLRRVAERLESRGMAHAVVREPGGTEAGERVRALVLDPEVELEAETELLLMLAARAEFVRKLVRPALSRGEVVLADRFELSTFAYQGVARELGLDRVRELNAFATGGLKPDLLVLLDPGPGEDRRERGPAADRLEREDADFHARVAEAYRRLSEREPEALAARADGVVRLRTDRPVEEVSSRLLRELRDRWPETFGEEPG